jgi:two-component system, NarL family, nitrate/nitrite response regulator NarL
MIPPVHLPHPPVLERSSAPNTGPEDACASSRSVEPGEVSVVVAASVRLYLDGVAHGLEAKGGMRVAALAATVPQTLDAVEASDPEVVLVDISMSGAIEMIRSLQQRAPRTSVIAFAVDDEHDDQLLACAEAGVSGWVGRDRSMNDLIEAIRNAARGELVCSARMAAVMARRLATLAGRRPAAPNPTQLTPRELEVADLLDQGMSNKHIARALSLQLATVKNHVHSILAKLGASSRSEAGALLRGRVPAVSGVGRSEP